jgi:hypothetical protein
MFLVPHLQLVLYRGAVCGAKINRKNHHLSIYRNQYQYGDSLSRRAVDAVFQALFLMTDIRALLRETAPLHKLDDNQKAEAAKILEKMKKQVDILEKELLS